MTRKLLHPRILIPLLAATCIAVLSSTQWGSLYATLQIFGKNDVTHVIIAGFQKPEVDLTLGTSDFDQLGTTHITLTITESITPPAARSDKSSIQDTPLNDDEIVVRRGAGGEVALTLPTSWHLEEARGIHVRNLTRTDATGTNLSRIGTTPDTSVAFPLTLTFTSHESIKEISFAHDSPEPALLTVTQVSLPDKTIDRKIELVRNTKTIGL